METWIILLVLALLNLKLPFAQGQPDSWIGIDCGSNRSTATNGITWQIDEGYIETGSNYLIPDDSPNHLAILNTLRVFEEQNKNCYTLPASSDTRYFIRAFFFYANYDGLSNPPTFDLQIDGNKWATIVTSSTEYTYYEIIYYCQNPSISVCLARTQDNQFPFISSLEAWPVGYNMYTSLPTDSAWLSSYRYNYGPNNGTVWYPDDGSNRIWEPVSVPGAVNTTADSGTSIFDGCDDSPPETALLDAVTEAQNGTSLFLSFNPVRAMTAIYIEAYFTEMQSASSGMRSFDMHAEDKIVAVNPEYSKCIQASTFVQTSTSNLTIELRPTAASQLPPIISAIEIYTASDPLVTTGTDENDMDGLAAFTSTFDQLKGWSGEPCLPADTVWQWLGCTGSNPPRVTSINLSGYNLNGALPDFSQMQALEHIDLSKNSLSGQIPQFLGQLPNLKNLNLSYNDFSGALPSSMCSNNRLNYTVVGNRLDVPPCTSSASPPPPPPPGGSKPSATGPAVGTSVVVVLIIGGIISWLIRRRRKRQGNNQPTVSETWIETGQNSFMTNASTANLIRPPPPAPPPPPHNAPMEDNNDDDDDCIPVSMLEAEPNKNQSMVPEMDFNELEELIDQHANEVNHENTQNDQCMVPDLDLEELDEIMKHEGKRDR